MCGIWAFLLLLLLLSRFSHVRLCVTPEMTAHQVPPSLGFSRQEVGCHFLLQCMKVKSEREVAQSCLTLRNPMDCSPPHSSVHEILQARVLEWGAIAFSVLQSYSHQDRMVLAQRQKYRSMEQNKKPRDKSAHLSTPYLWQKRQEYTMEKRQSL